MRAGLTLILTGHSRLPDTDTHLRIPQAILVETSHSWAGQVLVMGPAVLLPLGWTRPRSAVQNCRQTVRQDASAVEGGALPETVARAAYCSLCQSWELAGQPSLRPAKGNGAGLSSTVPWPSRI